MGLIPSFAGENTQAFKPQKLALLR